MDYNLSLHSDLISEPREYVMPLGGEEDEDGEHSAGYGEGRGRRFGADGSHDYKSGKWPSYRRSSNQTDATPRFQNTSNHGDGITSPPPIPLHIEKAQKASSGMDKSQKSQKSLASFIAKNNSSTVSFQLAAGNSNDSVSSYSFGGGSYPLTPTSNSASTFSKRTPDRMRRKIQQITMDGAIQEVPLTPQSRSTTTSSALKSILSQEKPPSSRKDDGENTLGSESLHSAHSTIANEEMGRERYPTERSKDRDLASVDTDFDELEPIECWNIVFPMWLSTLLRVPPSLNRIAHCLVHILPCFWCCAKASEGNTDRAILTRLNILCMLMTLVQLAAALALAVVLLFLQGDGKAFSDFEPHFWNLNGATFSVGILALILIITCTCTIRVIKEVDLTGAIRSLWVLLWVFPFETFFTISLYDYHRVTRVWIFHWWAAPHMRWFRKTFCPDGTSNDKCIVPINGGQGFENEEEWCLEFYGDTDCADIRDTAQTDMNRSILIYYTALAGWSSALLFIILLMVNSLERIISKPIVQKSRETNVPLWLSLPMLTNAIVGSVFLFSPSSLLTSSSGSDTTWIGPLYLIAAALFLVGLLTGWYLSVFTIRNSSDKQTKSVAVIIFIFVMFANALMLGVIFVACILLSTNLITSAITEEQVDDVACRLDFDISCTQCDLDPSEDLRRCPEWSENDVTRILLTQLKQSASLAAIFILYAVSMLRFGVTLRTYLSRYQIDYV